MTFNESNLKQAENIASIRALLKQYDVVKSAMRTNIIDKIQQAITLASHSKDQHTYDAMRGMLATVAKL